MASTIDLREGILLLSKTFAIKTQKYSTFIYSLTNLVLQGTNKSRKKKHQEKPSFQTCFLCIDSFIVDNPCIKSFNKPNKIVIIMRITVTRRIELLYINIKVITRSKWNWK